MSCPPQAIYASDTSQTRHAQRGAGRPLVRVRSCARSRPNVLRASGCASRRRDVSGPQIGATRRVYPRPPFLGGECAYVLRCDVIPSRALHPARWCDRRRGDLEARCRMRHNEPRPLSTQSHHTLPATAHGRRLRIVQYSRLEVYFVAPSALRNRHVYDTG